MRRILLFIRDVGHEDIVEFFTDEASAKADLSRLVRSRAAENEFPAGTTDEAAVSAYFETRDAVYTIVGVAGDNR